MKRLFAPFRRAAFPGVLALAVGLSLGGCSSLQDSLGANKKPPDEFNVVTRAPLVMPPSLDSLPAPQPGLNRPQELQPQEQAMAALLGGQVVTSTTASTAETMLLADANIEANEPDIRETIDIEHQTIVNDTDIVQDLQFWRDQPDPTEVVIDPAAERQRLQNNAALGLPANAGDFEGVIIAPKEKALLEGVF